MRNEKGFSLVLILGLLPILISMLLGILYLNSWLKPNENSVHICRVNLLEAEKTVGKVIQSILDLNKAVLSLRKSRAFAEAALKSAIASGYGPAIAAAEVVVQIIIASQTALQAKQSLLVIQGNQLMIKTPYETQRKISSLVQKTNGEYQPHFNLATTIKPTIPKLMAIRRIESTDSGPPTYELEEDFTRKQALHVSWILNESLQKRNQIWKKPSLTKNLNCAVSLKQESGSLMPVLLQDKFLWSSYF
jgi:hypothetical protein